MDKSKPRQSSLDASLKQDHSKENSFYKVLFGDVYASLLMLDNNSIDCAVTSPPYWSQRDYGFENQIGNEPELLNYISKLVCVYRLLRDKLSPRGIFYHNIGDKYLTKYGNTPLGMIPFQLAYYMVQDGWILEDIIIWYKPNHMPSSDVQNRFTNTYEPVFVFAKSSDNYYHTHKLRNSDSNILKINLQTITYAHMATYPEKLVEELLKFGIPDNGTILDPFGGSGTTCKSVQNLNNAHQIHRKCFLIEAQKEYVDIILQRCQLSEADIISCGTVPYHVQDIIDLYQAPFTNVEYTDREPKDLICNVINDNPTFNGFLPNLFNENYLDCLEDDGLLFILLPNHKIESIFAITKSPFWIIRNLIIIQEHNDWRPLFFLVKDTKMVNYRFNLDNIRVTHLMQAEEDFADRDFLGYKVVISKLVSDTTKSGLITNIFDKKRNGLPHWVLIKWETGEYSIEEIINPPLEDRKVEFFCPKCKSLLHIYYHSKKEISCLKCNTQLWLDKDSIPELKINSVNKPDFDVTHYDSNIDAKETKKDYNGKFKDAERINMGQSPGARASVSEQYFSVQRYYNVNQNLYCDYLNLMRETKKLSKMQLTQFFPPEYKHTVGHWLRKDMGGSLPKKEDLLRLKEILNLDSNYVDYVMRYGLKLQTVLANANGKNPGDYLELNLDQLKLMLEKLVE